MGGGRKLQRPEKALRRQPKSSPVRQQIQSEKTIENILESVGNDDTHFDDGFRHLDGGWK